MMRTVALLGLLLFACRDSLSDDSRRAKKVDQPPIQSTGSAALPLTVPTAAGTDSQAASVAVDKPMRVGGEVLAPVALKRVEPRYPEITGEYEIGMMVLEMVVTRNGAVSNLRVVRGPSNAFAEAIVAAVKRWHFRPATLHGRPVAVVYNMKFNHVPVSRVEHAVRE